MGEQGDKGSIGKAIDGPTGDQGHQGMKVYLEAVITTSAGLVQEKVNTFGVHSF